MITLACRSSEDNAQVIQFLIDMGGKINLQNNVSVMIFIITFNLCKDIYYNIRLM